MTKVIGTFLVLSGLGLAVGLIMEGLNIHNQFETAIQSNWELSDRSSTLDAKAQYIEAYYNALESSGINGLSNALFYQNPTNDCATNIQVVKTLSDRLEQIKGMDESSFQYQQAIQQITAQEQGEAGDMTDTLHGCWLRANHYIYWNPIIALFMFIIPVFLLFMGGFLISYEEL